MSTKLQYKINKHISLKLQGDKTHIYVNEEELMLCKKIAVNIPVCKLDDINKIKSIDDLENINYIEIRKNNDSSQVTPKTEFFVHCSNIEVWAENGYDTQLIHSNLAFPLLKSLTEVGDIQAKNVFKEEIVKRYLEGNQKVQEFLTTEGYLHLLNSEERDFILGKNAHKIKKIEKDLGSKIKIVDRVELHKEGIELSQREIRGFGVKGNIKFFIPNEIKYFKKLKKLFLQHFLDTKLPEWIGNLTELEILDLRYNKIESISNNISNLSNLKVFKLRNNCLKTLPKLISRLENLEDIILSKNQFEEFPLELCTLPKLWGLSLNQNRIKIIPPEIKQLTHLREIDLSDNPLESISEELINLPDIELIILPYDSLIINEEKAKKKKIRIIRK